MIFVLYNKLRKRCNPVIADGDLTLWPIAEKKFEKLDEYLPLMATEQAELARRVDPRFANDYLHDSDVLQRRVILPVKDVVVSPSNVPSRQRTPLEELMDERSMYAPVMMKLFTF